jgi:hypothetical protein
MRYAKDEKCIKCGKPAVCFWPVVDPDIPDHPYCRECVQEAKFRIVEKLSKLK